MAYKSKRDQSPNSNRPNMSDLRIILVGKKASENNKVGNLIFNDNVFENNVETFSRKVEGRNITVISAIHLLKSNLSLPKLAQKVSALSHPEPDVIILVLQHNDFSKNNKDRLTSVKQFFGDRAKKRMLILTTDDETLGAELKSVKENEFITEMSTECGGSCLQLKNTQHFQILKKVNEIITCSGFKETHQVPSLDREHSRTERSVRPRERAAGFDYQKFGKHDERHQEEHDNSQRRQSQNEEHPNMSDLRLILLGKNPSENSRVRNIILGIDVYESEEAIAFQQYCLRISGTVKNRQVTVINTLRLLNLNISDYQLTQTVRECVNLSAPGPHVFIIILQYKGITMEDISRVKLVLSKFSEEAIERTIVLTTDKKTHSLQISSRINQSTLNQLIKECRGRHLQLEKENSEWHNEIFKTVDNILKGRQEEFLTCEIYEDVKVSSVDEEHSRSDDSSRSEEEKEESSHHRNDGNPKQSKIREVSANPSKKQKLNLVLCGSDTTLKDFVSKFIQEKKCKSSDQKAGREVCVKKENNIHGRLINLVELPALNRLSEEEVKHQTLLCVSLCDPGVHVFLLIIPAGPLTDEDKAEIKKIQIIFDCKEHFVVLFTTELSIEIDLMSAINFVKSNTESRRLISIYGDQQRVMWLQEPEKSEQILELLEYIESMKIEPYSLQMYVKDQENRVRHELEEQHKKELKRMEDKIKQLKQTIQSESAEGESDDQECLRIVLIGRTGNGKSATGNTILGRNKFVSQVSMDSVSTVCQKGVGEVGGRSVAVVDTPGLFDTTLTNEQVVEEIVKCVSLSSPGPHVFVIVLSLGRFTREEAETVDLIKKIFGHKAAQFSIVVFTRGDELGDMSIEDYVKRSNNEEPKKLIKDCGNRFLAFNNINKQDRSQVTQLLNMIEEVKNMNHGRYFTNSMFEEAEMSIKKRTEEILKEREREIQTQIKSLKDKYEMEMKIMIMRLEEEKQRANDEREKMENTFIEKEENLRKEFEEKEKTEQNKKIFENQKRLKEEKQQKAEYHQKIEEMRREIENQRSQYEKQQKEREEENKKKEEKYRQAQEKMKNEQECIIAEFRMKQEEEIKKRESEKQRRNEEEEKERQRWERKIKDAENDRKEILEEIKRQQREWEDEKKRQTREREEDERKRKEKHDEQLREKQEELEKMRKRFEKEREEEREKIEEEREKQRREREEKEREYNKKTTEMNKHYERLERERKEEWERRKQDDDERQEEERKRWKKMIEDLKREKEEEIKRVETERKVREEKERDEMKRKYEEEIKEMKKKHEDEARNQAELFNDLRERKEEHIQELKEMLKERQEQQELLENLYKHLKDQKGEEIKDLQRQVEDLKNKRGSCVIL